MSKKCGHSKGSDNINNTWGGKTKASKSMQSCLLCARFAGQEGLAVFGSQAVALAGGIGRGTGGREERVLCESCFCGKMLCSSFSDYRVCFFQWFSCALLIVTSVFVIMSCVFQSISCCFSTCLMTVLFLQKCPATFKSISGASMLVFGQSRAILDPLADFFSNEVFC